jgi:hypothetical protein
MGCLVFIVLVVLLTHWLGFFGALLVSGILVALLSDRA